MAKKRKDSPSIYQPRYTTHPSGDGPDSIDYDIHASPSPKNSKRARTQRLMGKKISIGTPSGGIRPVELDEIWTPKEKK